MRTLDSQSRNKLKKLVENRRVGRRLKPQGSSTTKPAASELVAASAAHSLENVDLLILAANAGTQPTLDLKRESERIAAEVAPRPGRPGLKLAAIHTTTVEELTRYIREAHPRILHFAGHGIGGDLVLVDSDGSARRVSPEMIREILRVLHGRLECVVLNACETLFLIDTLRAETVAVIGMSRRISDRGAQAFATGFYRTLSFGDNYLHAFEQALIQIGLESPADHDIPRLYIGRKPATLHDVTRSLLDSILMHSKDGSTTRSYAPSEPEKSGICTRFGLARIESPSTRKIFARDLAPNEPTN